MVVLKTSSVPVASDSLYRGQKSLSSAHWPLGSPVRTKDSRYFCMVTATVALTLELPPMPPPLPPGPPVVELLADVPVAEAAVEVAVATTALVVVVVSSDEVSRV